MDGDVEGLQRLFSQGEASPFTVRLEILPDGCINSRTLLEVRVVHPTFISISNISRLELITGTLSFASF
jgi:hypothetical protein